MKKRLVNFTIMRLSLFILLFINNCSLIGGDMSKKLSKKFVSDVTVNVNLDYNIYFPSDYHKTKDNYPLVLFLHGAGERGNDLNKVEIHGIPKLIKKGREFPFITVAPQCPAFQWWSEPLYVRALILLLEDMIEKYNIDIKRIYATGLSMGGYGTLSIGKERPDLFAALIPVCGGVDMDGIESLKNIPIWLFHGDKDKVVPVENSQRIYDRLAPINPKIKLTIYDGVNHNSWDATYDNDNIYDWLLENKK